MLVLVCVVLVCVGVGPTILAALKKAQSRAQERPVSDRIVATKSFLLRAQKRVEHAAQVAVKAREALEEALASQAKEEGLLADGQRRLEQLLVEERETPNPFTAPPGPSAIPTAPAEVSRLQAIIDRLQQEISQLRVGVVRSTAMDDDDDDAVVDLPHKKPRGAPATPLAITGGHAPQTPPAITGGHGQGLTQSR